MLVPDTQFGKFIVAAGLIGQAELDKALVEIAQTGEKLEQALAKGGNITPDELHRIKALMLGVPTVDLKDRKIPLETLRLIPEPLARKYQVVAYAHHKDHVEVAMLDLENQKVLTELAAKLQTKFVSRLTDTASIKEALVVYQKGLKDHFGSIIQQEAEAVRNTYGAKLAGLADSDMAKLSAEPSVIKLANALLKHALIQGVSDMYLEPTAEHYLIRYRLNGSLYESMKLSKIAGLAILVRLKTLAKIAPTLSADGSFKAVIDGQKVSVRLASWPTYHGEQVIARLLAEGPAGFTLEHLGLHGEALEIVHKFLHRQSGLIVAAGPVDSGKTTALYTMLDILNRPDLLLSSVEEPIEHTLTGVNQCNVRASQGFTAVQALRAALRQDPDVVMFGQLTTAEETTVVSNAVLGNRRLLTAMLAPSAATALSQLAAWLPPSVVPGDFNCLIIGERLVKRLRPNQRKPYRLTAAILAKLQAKANLTRVLAALKAERIVPEEATWEQIDFYEASQPESMENELFSGQIGLFEVLPVSPAISKLCQQQSHAFDLQNQARTEGMLTMYEDGLFKCVQGLTTLSELDRVLQ